MATLLTTLVPTRGLGDGSDTSYISSNPISDGWTFADMTSISDTWVGSSTTGTIEYVVLSCRARTGVTAQGGSVFDIWSISWTAAGISGPQAAVNDWTSAFTTQQVTIMTPPTGGSWTMAKVLALDAGVLAEFVQSDPGDFGYIEFADAVLYVYGTPATPITGGVTTTTYDLGFGIDVGSSKNGMNREDVGGPNPVTSNPDYDPARGFVPQPRDFIGGERNDG